ncbi:xanthine dehydrogenase family Fe-S subunit [Aquabacter sp. P-9]|uniref:xanthine dehydrogenase family Fe-S subunit n=1 Tax=Aquabacter sediminis TaxID=3029197 RepID=UPI00237D610D|nr:2Fe-2S iron-sulfur cluster-binding protein [Aquabacter sp. P-9]MDE1570031.1 2Fe-2S iron-sulfur cluster-binding protein [Aquabacter sp. P-9]
MTAAPTLSAAPVAAEPLVSFTLNGRPVAVQVEPRTSLADLVRDTLNLTGTHLGCEHGVCGACTLLVDGEPARGCLAFAGACQGAQITTIEGLDDDSIAAELRAAFNAEHALQCGFCTPGMLVSARDLVLRLPEPDETRIRLGLAGNLCRCTGYAGIVKAVASVIAARRARGVGPLIAERRLGPVGARRGQGADAVVPVAGPVQPALIVSAAALVDDFTPAHRFEQSFEVPYPPADVFAFFGRIEEVAACLPGAVITAVPAPDQVEGGMRVKLGPIATTFRGTARITRDAAQARGTIHGAGGDGRSRTEGRIAYAVTPGAAPGTTRVALSVGYTLKGPLAQFGRPGLVREVASRLIAEFAANLNARLAGAPAPAVAGRGLDPLRLLLALISDRLGRLWPRGGPSS